MNIGKCVFRVWISYFILGVCDLEVEEYFVVYVEIGIIRFIKLLDYEVRNRYFFYVGVVGKVMKIKKVNLFFLLFFLSCCLI